MTIKNGDSPAMPVLDESREQQCNGVTTTVHSVLSYGLTKREQFAAMAMQGILSCDNSEFSHIAAQRAAECADALLFELENSK